MGAKIEVPITGTVLDWAMVEAGFTVPTLAESLKVESEHVQAWIDETERPGKTEFSRIVNVLRRPSAVFFMPSPPIDAGMPTELRHAPGSHGKTLAASALRDIRKSRRLQRASSFIISTVSPNELVSVPQYSWERDNARRAGAQVREEFGISFEEQIGWRDAREALSEWKQLFEDLGILVFSLQLGSEGIRGFSSWDSFAPLVAINTAYVESARIFTLAHELAHLVTRTISACSDWISPQRPSEDKLERWCEEFAASFLLPPSMLATYVRDKYGISRKNPVKDFDTVWAISRRLKVSARALAIALMEAHLGVSDLYRTVERNARKVDRRPERESTGGGEPRVKKRLRQYGARSTGLLLGAANSGLLGIRDVSDYLDLNLNQLEDLNDELHRTPAIAR